MFPPVNNCITFVSFCQPLDNKTIQGWQIQLKNILFNYAKYKRRNTDFIVGVLYGEVAELSMHYKNINVLHPVIIGLDFWHRLTGFPNFYNGLVESLHQLINSLDTQDLIHQGCNKLADEIRNSKLFVF